MRGKSLKIGNNRTQKEEIDYESGLYSGDAAAENDRKALAIERLLMAATPPLGQSLIPIFLALASKNPTAVVLAFKNKQTFCVDHQYIEDQFAAGAFLQKLQQGNHFLAGHIAPDNDFGFRQFRRFQFDFQILSPFLVRP